MAELVNWQRTAEFEARRRGERPEKYEYVSEETLELKALPCWSVLSRKEIAERTAELVRDIEAETRLRLKQEDKSPMGRARILRQSLTMPPDRSFAHRHHGSTP